MSVKYAYGYIRVSTHDQEEISPDSQEHLLRDYAAKNNIVILKIFTDLGISGRKANKRPGFQEMIGLAKGDDHPVDQIELGAGGNDVRFVLEPVARADFDQFDVSGGHGESPDV